MKRLCLIILYSVILAGACKKEALNYTARLTMLNAVPDANSFELYTGESKINAPIVFGMPDYLVPVPAATDSLKWKIAGRAAFDSAFLTDLPNGKDFTILFYDSASRYMSYITKDNWVTETSDQQGYYRFFPMIVGAGQIKITNDTGKVLISGRSFGDFQDRVENFSVIDSFTTKLRLYNNNILIDSVPGATIKPGRSYTIYGVGVLNETGDKRPRIIIKEHE